MKTSGEKKRIRAKIFPSSIYAQLAGFFLIVFFCMGMVASVIAARATLGYTIHGEQVAYRHIARLILEKVDVSELLKAPKQLSQSLRDSLEINPEIAAYLLDKKGRILASSVSDNRLETQSVFMKPVKDYLAGKSFPLFGVDPTNLSRPKPIIVEPVAEHYLYVTIRGEQIHRGLEAVRNYYRTRFFFPSFFIAYIVTGIVGLVIFIYFTRKFRLITQQVKLFADGDLSQRIDITDDNEIGELASAFNQMANKLEENIDELQKNDRLRRELIANLSHDLRTPLTSISGYAEVLCESRNLTPEKRNKYTEIVLASSRSLSRLITQLFELAKLEAREREPSFEPHDIRKIIGQAADLCSPDAEKKQITIVQETPGDLPRVTVDGSMLERSLVNLINNSIRYSPEGSRVMIKAEVKEDKLLLSVADNGPGVPEEDLPKLFDRYYRSELVRSKVLGTGLGLTIVKKIVDTHNGEIWAESQPGEGLKVFISIPR